MNEWERLHRQAKKYKEMYQPGTRILLLSMGDDPRPIEPDTRGTVEAVDAIGTIQCHFDNGRYLGIIPNEDSFRRLTEEELAEENKQVMNFGNYCKITIPEEPVDCCKPGFLDKLQKECWALVKSYCTAFGVEILPDEEGKIPVASDIVQKIQNTILNQLWEYGVEMRTKDSVMDGEKMQAIRMKLSKMDDNSPFFCDHGFCFSSIDDLFDYFYDWDVCKEELVRDLNTEQKIELLQQYKDRFLQINGKYYCYNEGFCNYECDEDNSPVMGM